ncbi:MAG TPA: histidine kinase [Methylococcaceae bacterium]|nr:histidine kinase [Methylococcaceae bacterium]
MESSLSSWTINTIDPGLDNFSHPVDLREEINRIKALPPLPGIARQIIELASDPLADVKKLAAIIEMDPILSSQVIRWASSALYGYRGKIASIQESIARVLGYDFVMNLALGLSALSPLNAPKIGKVGTRMLWIQAIAGSRLTLTLGEMMSAEERPDRQTLFLASLLHNIGFPLLGHEFPKEFAYLSRIIDANVTLSVYNIERFAFGVDHTLLGTWLMRSWSMPKPIVDVVYHHHNPHYRGDNYRLNLLVYLSDCLLGTLGIGDGQNQNYGEEEFAVLNLNSDAVHQKLAEFSASLDDIAAMADQLTS